MKTIKYSIIIILFLSLFHSSSQYSQFLQTYNITPGSTECGRSLEMSVLNTFTEAGYTNASPSAGNYDWLFQKFNNNGNHLGTVLLGFPQADSCFSHTKLSGVSTNVMAGFYITTWKAFTREIASWSMVDENTFNHLGSKMVIDSFRSQYRSVVRGHLGNNYALAGYSEANTSNGGLKRKILAGLYDAAGNKIWLNRYSTSNFRNEMAYSICYQPLDSSYAVTGVVIDSTASGNFKRIFVMKLTLSGNPLWYKVYAPLTGNYTHMKSESRRIIAMPDGGFVITGWTEEPAPASGMNILVFRISSNGAGVWSNTYGLTNVTEQSYAIERNLNGSELVLTGFTNKNSTEDILNMKIDGSGNHLWTRVSVNLIGEDRGYDVKFAKKMIHATAFYWFTGQYHKTPVNVLNTYFMKTKINGYILNYPGSCTDTLTLPKVQNILRIDTAAVLTHALNDLPITPVQTIRKSKTDTVCISTPPSPFTVETDGKGTIQPFKYSLEQNYPNPFNPSTLISYSIAADGNVSVKVYDITGKEVAVIINGFKPAGNYSAEFNASSLPSGVYLYKIKAEGFEQTKKMLLVK